MQCEGEGKRSEGVKEYTVTVLVYLARKDNKYSVTVLVLDSRKGQQVSCNSAGIFQQRKDNKVSLYLQVLQSGQSRLGKLIQEHNFMVDFL
jgi:hypothetical protein